jgi:hypothetical protein
VLKSRFSTKYPSYRYAFISTAIILIWGIGFGGRFWRTLINDPIHLELPDRDQHEYFRNQTGYALQDVVEDVSELPMISENSD